VTEALRAGRRRIEISHPDKVMFPRARRGTKLDLARYYVDVAEVMVPHARGRPVTMHQFPGGVAAPGFYVKNAPDYFPEWIDRVTVGKRGGTVSHVMIDDAATLLYLANQNCVTPHVWPTRADDLQHPDRLIFDLDPAGDRFAEVRAAARAMGDLLRDHGLEPFAMTTGSRGLHVVAPLRRDLGGDRVRMLARSLGQALAEQDPRHLTVEFYKEKRDGRIYVDTARNSPAQHAVAPYAVRARPTAPVAVPLRWDELSDRRLKPDRWTIETAPRRLASDGDAWKGIGRRARSPRRALERLETRS
jgi:bifunctional non-homologous end joining protein LigD